MMNKHGFYALALASNLAKGKYGKLKSMKIVLTKVK